jgi:hypothetical protein
MPITKRFEKSFRMICGLNVMRRNDVSKNTNACNQINIFKNEIRLNKSPAMVRSRTETNHGSSAGISGVFVAALAERVIISTLFVVLPAFETCF